jgi:hypothetical protein
VLLSSLSCFLVSHDASCFVVSRLMLSGYLDCLMCGGNRQRHHQRYPEPSFDACARMLAFLSSFRGKTDGRRFVQDHSALIRRTDGRRRRAVRCHKNSNSFSSSLMLASPSHLRLHHDEMTGTFFAVLP